MKHTHSAGGVVLGRGGTVVLVRNTNGPVWTFPKGHIEEGEDDETAARREIQEETGLTDLEYIDDLGSFERFRIGETAEEEDRSEMKEMHMFLFAAYDTSLSPSHEIAEARWVPHREVAELLSHPKDKVWYGSVFERVREAIQRD